MVRFISSLWAQGIVAFTSVAVVGLDGQCQQAVTIERVRDVWSAREAKVNSARFRWEKRQVVLKGSYDKYIAGRVKDGRTHPPTDLTINGTCILSIEGGKLRYEYSGSEWSFSTYRLEPKKKISTYDGSKYKEVVLTNPGHNYPRATVIPSAEHSEFRSLDIRPIWLAVRGIQSIDKGFPFLRHEPTGRVIQINGRLCLEFIMKSRSEDSLSQLFLDTERDYLLVRRLETETGKVKLKQDVDYQSDSTMSWVPKSWEYITRNRSGETVSSVSCRMIEVECNLSLHAQDFDADLPPKTWVTDLTGPKATQYVILPDGRRTSPIVSEGKYLTYDDLLRAGPEKGFYRWGLLIGSFVGTICSIILFCSLRSRRRKLLKARLESPTHKL